MIRSVEAFIYRRLGGEWCGNVCPPDDQLTHRIRTYEDGSGYICARTGDDGFVLWIGSDTQWWGFLNHREALRLAWFIVWSWCVRGRWFGLRRWLWYRALHSRVSRYQRLPK